MVVVTLESAPTNAPPTTRPGLGASWDTTSGKTAAAAAAAQDLSLTHTHTDNRPKVTNLTITFLLLGLQD